MRLGERTDCTRNRMTNTDGWIVKAVKGRVDNDMRKSQD